MITGTALERELVFVMRMESYDAIRTCCQGPKMCPKCWVFLGVAARVLTMLLRDNWGFENLLFVYSGCRGLHMWVCDEKARALDDKQRAAMMDFIAALGGYCGFGSGRASAGAWTGVDKTPPSIGRTAAALTVPLHPALARVYGDLESAFERAIVPETGQRLLATPENWVCILDAIPALPAGLPDLHAAVSVCLPSC
mgnify:CR=1 FL=1